MTGIFTDALRTSAAVEAVGAILAFIFCRILITIDAIFSPELGLTGRVTCVCAEESLIARTAVGTVIAIVTTVEIGIESAIVAVAVARKS